MKRLLLLVLLFSSFGLSADSKQSTTIKNLEAVIKAIQQAAKTDQIGDGKIFVTDLSKVIRIRTGETGPSAI